MSSRRAAHHSVSQGQALAYLEEVDSIIQSFLGSYDKFLEGKDRITSILRGKAMNVFPRKEAQKIQVVFLDKHQNEQTVTITANLSSVRQFVDGPFTNTISRTKRFKSEVERDY